MLIGALVVSSLVAPVGWHVEMVRAWEVIGAACRDSRTAHGAGSVALYTFRGLRPAKR